MTLNKEDLRKLSPEERIKKLKEFEEEKSKEAEEAKDLIKRTEAEIERNKNIPDIDVPAIEEVDIAKIFEAEEGLEGAVDVKSEEDSPVKYDAGSGEYVEKPFDEHAQEKIEKTTDTTKYETTAEQLGELTATSSAHKTTKKYSRGER